MKKTPKNAKRADGLLSPEELKKAVEEYKARRAAAEKATDGDEPVKETPAPEATPVMDGDEPTTEEPTVEEKVAALKENKDRRDEEGEPENVEAAKDVITDQEDDISKLFDIIDTLLAQKAFDEGDEPVVEEPKKDEPVVGAADGEGCEPLTEDSEDDDIPNSTPADEPLMNADSIDAIVRQRVQLGMIGEKLNLDGLEKMSIANAKKAVIAAVRPSMRLDGKSAAFINAAYEMAADEINARSNSSVPTQKRQMFNKNTQRADSKDTGDSSMSARQRMIDRQMKKEDK